MALATLKKLTKNKELKHKESSAEESDASSETSKVDRVEGNEGWANSIAKVLNTTKPKAKKSLVLSRAKKVKPVQAQLKTSTEEYSFDVAESSVIVENIDAEVKPIKEEDDEDIDIKPKNLKLALRMRPTWRDIERERVLRKIATKGVVQLFNAVRVQQKQLEHELKAAGPLDSRRDAVLNNIDKRKFLDVLMSGNRANSEKVTGKIKREDEESSNNSSSEDDSNEDENKQKMKKKWSVLEPDFLTSKKAKHWDEEESNEETAMNSSGADDSDKE